MVPPILPPPPPAPRDTSVTVGTTKLQALRDQLHADQEEAQHARRAERCDAAIETWRTAAKGEGHHAFFVLACRLAYAGLSYRDIDTILHHEALMAHSPMERRQEIKAIMSKLTRLSRVT